MFFQPNKNQDMTRARQLAGPEVMSCSFFRGPAGWGHVMFFSRGRPGRGHVMFTFRGGQGHVMFFRQTGLGWSLGLVLQGFLEANTARNKNHDMTPPGWPDWAI